MNKFAIAFVACITVAAAAVVPVPVTSDDARAETLRLDSVVNPDSFQYAFETSNGIKASEAGQLKQVGQEKEPGIAVQGDFEYKTDGQVYKVSYIADENGYQPTGDHLPVPPPIPDAIRRALEWLAEHGTSEE